MHGQRWALDFASAYLSWEQHGKSCRRAKVKSELIMAQGHLYYRRFDTRRRCQSTADTNEEPYLHHLLRSRRHLRGHNVDRLLCEA